MAPVREGRGYARTLASSDKPTFFLPCAIPGGERGLAAPPRSGSALRSETGNQRRNIGAAEIRGSDQEPGAHAAPIQSCIDEHVQASLDAFN